MTIQEALSWAGQLLEEKGVKGPKSSARVLLCQVLEKNIAYLFTYPEKELEQEAEEKFRGWIERRAKHEPVWYIAGNKIDFYGQEYYVDGNVLIPRPETELLIEKLIQDLLEIRSSKLRILDVGTGSGAIILSLAKALSEYSSSEQSESRSIVSDSSRLRSNNKYFASDISKEALNVARKNAEKFGTDIEFRLGNLFGPWDGEKFDCIVTNLPYIPHEDIPYLDKDLTHYEPMTALDGGKSGLEIYQAFFEQVPNYLAENGLIYCEIGHDQGKAITDMARECFPSAEISLFGDYSEKDRIVIIDLAKTKVIEGV